ncbi:hypothetical protein KSD_91860 [Ktedonobacter sp. SOSP1-85]|uniref:hypothetical protein n=1 Tax=Ktedonobacter sp. SOSP1-85 TaxID=2778367 RepID=UPI0019153161|nr:hypothetical protein [Ktedonobacter sp. SOSP1-85]GHO81415.1 hypothetical protein KSD_91860 [Ktedonobacter sp. SOSP1-85]
MRAPIHLRFRPGLVIFVDETGQHICTQFMSLLQRTKPGSVLCQGMTLLQLDTQKRTATRLPLTRPLEQAQISTAEARPFELLVTHTLQEIQSNQLITGITRAGYPVPDSRAQIYIVGDPTHSPLAQVQQALQAQLQRTNNHSFICSMLRTQLEAPLNLALPTHFCYLYQGNSIQPQQAFLSEDETCYAIAEALFTLLLTSITTEPFFMEMIRGGTNPATPIVVGSLSTSLVLSPRETIQDYCALRLGRDLLEQWRRGLQETPIATSRREELQTGARGFAKTLTHWLEDSQKRPLTNTTHGLHWSMHPHQRPEHLAPSLDGLRSTPPSQLPNSEDTARLHSQLSEQEQALFACFWPEAVQYAFTHQPGVAMNWSELVACRAKKAPERYNAWNASATLAWQAMSTLINTSLQQITTETSQVDETGLHLAMLYIDEFAAQVAQLERRCLAWQSVHQRGYNETMHTFAARVGLPQATPAALEEPPQADKQPSSGLTTEETEIAQRLGERLTRREARVPSPAAQALIALPFLIAVLITLPLLYPISILANIIAGVSTATFLAHGLFHYQRQQAVRVARSDLLDFHRLAYVHRCELREDELRTKLIQELQDRVHDLRKRLHDLAPCFVTLRDQFSEQAERLQQELYNSPAGSRDVLVVNGELLQRGSSNTLEEIVEQVNKMRTLAPVQSWHQTLPAIQQHFLRTLTATGQSLPTSNQDNLRRQLIAFAREIIQPYCSGEMTELGPALTKDDAWREAFTQARKLLYQPGPGMSEQSVTFVCGRERELQRNALHIPDDAYPVYLPETHPWLIIATFSRGNLLTAEESYARTYTHAHHDDSSNSA